VLRASALAVAVVPLRFQLQLPMASLLSFGPIFRTLILEISE